MEEKNDHTFNKIEYASIFERFSHLVKHSQKESKEAQLNTIESFVPKDSNDREVYLEIGCGEGLVLDRIGKYFEKKIVCEPNEVYAKNAKDKGCVVYQNTFLNTEVKEKFDFCVCAHVFYYFGDKEMELALNNLLSMKKNDSSRIIVAMDELTSTSIHDEICEVIVNTIKVGDLINKEERNIHRTINMLKERGIPYEEKNLVYELTYDNPSDLICIYNFLVVENKINQDVYKNLTQEEKDKIDEIIKEKCNSINLPCNFKRIETFISF
jgi:hypothetical protein